MLPRGARIETRVTGLEAAALLVDSWRASALQPAPVVHDLAARLTWVVRQSGWPCAHSLVVAIAGFTACALSSWLPIAHFGVFCALYATFITARTQDESALCSTPALP